MILYRELQSFAAETLSTRQVAEVSVRRSVSGIYYGLFHHLTGLAADLFAVGGPALTSQAKRAFNHGAMRKVCEVFVRAGYQPLPAPFNRMMAASPDPRLVQVATMFIVLQEARHAADYDLDAEFLQRDALELLHDAELAHWNLEQVAGHADTAVFLTALLLADRWTRRG